MEMWAEVQSQKKRCSHGKGNKSNEWGKGGGLQLPGAVTKH